MTYSIPFEVAQSDLGDAEQVCLHLGKVFESVEVLVNHQNCGTTIAPPYVFLCDAVPESWENELTIKIQNNMDMGFQEIFFYAKSARQVAL
jgi:hypothetical protein